MQRPTQSACSPPHDSQPPSMMLPHARAPPPAHRRTGPRPGSADHGLQHLYGEGQQMKRRIAVVALVFVAFALIAQQALAQNEHFISARASLNNNGMLTVSFKEAGLGTNQLITYVASADATATYVCVIPEGAGTVNPATRIIWVWCAVPFVEAGSRQPPTGSMMERPQRGRTTLGPSRG